MLLLENKRAPDEFSRLLSNDNVGARATSKASVMGSKPFDGRFKQRHQVKIASNNQPEGTHSKPPALPRFTYSNAVILSENQGIWSCQSSLN